MFLERFKKSEEVNTETEVIEEIVVEEKPEAEVEAAPEVEATSAVEEEPVTDEATEDKKEESEVEEAKAEDELEVVEEEEKAEEESEAEEEAETEGEPEAEVEEEPKAEEELVVEEEPVVEELAEEKIEEAPVLEELTEAAPAEATEYMDEDAVEESKSKIPAKKIALISLASLMGLLLVAYLGMSAYFSQCFYYGTIIDGRDYSWKQVEDVEDDQEDIVEDYELVIVQITGEESILTSEAAGIEYSEQDEIQSILKSQNPFLWPTMLWDTFVYETTIVIEYEEEEVAQAVADLDCMNVFQMIAPTDAYAAVVGDAYEAISQEYGTELDSDAVVENVIKALVNLDASMDLLETGCYVEADVTTESEELLELIDNLNYYATATITYEEGFVCDASTISEWLIINDDNSVSLDEEKITEYVAGLAEEYNTVGTTRTFISGSGEEVEVSGGTYGWTVDQDEEVALIIESLNAGEATEREIEYSRRAITHDDVDWGDTYTEIDLTNQKVYYILEGEVVVEGDIVTGDVSDGNATPQGVYGLTYKTTNAVLRGTQYADGTYAYESPVSYWMPFNGGIGMHDASWRSSFGGTIYQYNGSHGCINMNYSTAQAIYSYISAGDPIICHY